MKNLVVLLALVLVFALTSESQAQRPSRDDNGQPGVQRKEGGRQASNRRPGMQDPQAMVVNMLKEFDKNGDQKLDADELVKMFTRLRERRTAAGNARGPQTDQGAGAPGRPGVDEQRKGKSKRGKKGGKAPDGSKAEEFNGVKPKRPGGKLLES